jgi:DNA repair protein RecO (recombination protein O)
MPWKATCVMDERLHSLCSWGEAGGSEDEAMEWTDTGIVLGTRRHGEANAILELMTRAHGRHLGLVRGGAGSRLKPVLQPGNTVAATWRARLDEHLGYYVVEGLDLRAASFLPAAHAVYGATHLAALCRLLPERDPHEAVFDLLEAALAALGDPAAAAVLVARFELQLLAELGFGLDLSACAATGGVADLVYVSPKSGRAVSRAAGEPWHDRLLALPAFLGEDGAPHPTPDELAAGFALTGFFLERHLYAPHGTVLPDARAHFIAAVTRAIARVA